MKIAVFIKSTTFHKGYGGLETQNKTLCENLVKKGHEIVVFSPKKEIEKNEEMLNGVKYVFVSCTYKNSLFAHINKNSWYKKSVEAFDLVSKNFKFDLVLSQSSAGEGIIKNKEKFGVKVVSVAHGTSLSEFQTFLQNVSFKDFFKVLINLQYFIRQYFGRQRNYILGSSKVIAVSNAVKKSLMFETFVPEERVEVIHNGVDPEKILEKSLYEADTVKMVYVGRIETSKGVFALVDALGELLISDAGERDTNIELHFIGGGDALEDLKKYVDERGCSEKVIFHGKLPTPEDVYKKLVEFDIFVFPSQRIEGFPMTIPEAMFAGLPVVATDMGGISDAIEHEKTGYLLQPGDTHSLVSSIKSLINDPNLRETFGKTGRNKACNEFTIQVMIDKYERVFGEVLK